jgi:hypothetical protein
LRLHRLTADLRRLGFSELGGIAGVGMIVAYLAGITLLPALLRALNPPGEKEPLGFRALVPIDRFTERHRVAIIAGTLVVVFGGLPLLYFLRFDFNPMNLRSPKAEASMPHASPYTTARPASPSSRARRPARHRSSAGGTDSRAHPAPRSSRPRTLPP